VARKSSTPTTIAQALRCVAKVNQGKPCTMNELKASLRLINDARKTGLKTIKMLKDQNTFLSRFIGNRGA
tara:strand:- start:592 stop:801 length:210 start_codon:yes stop_codon:yes gene_type:complete